MRGEAPRRGLSYSDLGVIRDGSLLIEDGRISEVGSTRRIENLRKARTARLVDVNGKVVTPGLIDSNVRLGAGPPLLQAFEQRIAGIAPTSQASPADRSGKRDKVWDRARRWLRLAASTGTTTVEVRSGGGLPPLQELRALRAASKLNGEPIGVLVGFRAALAAGKGDSGEQIEEVLRKGSSPLRVASVFDLDCGEEGVDRALASRLLGMAARRGYHTRIQTAAVRPNGSVRLAVEAGALTAEGLEAVGETEIDLIAASSIVGTLFPSVAYHRGAGRFPPARRLLDRGAAVSLASGFSPDVHPGFGLPLAMALGCRELRLMPEEVITCCTINAAAAVGLADRAGSLQPGKDADLAVFDVGDYREIPFYFGANLCLLTMKRGRIVFRAGGHTRPSSAHSRQELE